MGGWGDLAGHSRPQQILLLLFLLDSDPLPVDLVRLGLEPCQIYTLFPARHMATRLARTLSRTAACSLSPKPQASSLSPKPQA